MIERSETDLMIRDGLRGLNDEEIRRDATFLVNHWTTRQVERSGACLEAMSRSPA